MMVRIIALFACSCVLACGGDGREMRELETNGPDSGTGAQDGGDPESDAGMDADLFEECEGLSIRESGSLAYDLIPARVRVELRWQGGALPEPGQLVFAAPRHEVVAQVEGIDKSVATLVVEPGLYEVRYQPPAGCLRGPCTPVLLDEQLDVRADGNVTYDVEAGDSAQVRVELTLAGRSIPVDALGAIELRSLREDGTHAPTTQSRELASSVLFDVPAGDYQLYFVPEAGACGLQPAPCHPQLLLPRLAVAGDASVAADIEATDVRLSVRLNGSIYPPEPASIAVRSENEGWSFSQPLKADGQSSFVVAPGKLLVEVVPSGACEASRLPCQRYSKAVSITKSATPQTLLIEMQSIRVTPQLTVNDLPASGGWGELRFIARDGQTDSITVSAETRVVELFGGRYDVLYRGANPSYCREVQGLPCGLQRVGQDLDLRVSGALRVDLRVAAVRLQATLNGSPIPTGANALLEMRSQLASSDLNPKDEQLDALHLNVSINDLEPLYVTHGAYELWYGTSPADCYAEENELPCHSRRLSELNVVADGALRADLQSVVVRLDARHLGTALGAQDLELIRVRPTANDGETGYATLPSHGSLALFPGAYRVSYARESECGDLLPCGCAALLDTDLQSSGVLTVEVPSLDLALSVTSRGQNVTSDLGQIRLRSISNDCSVSLALAEGSGPYQIKLIPDDYVIARAPTPGVCSALSVAACHDEVLAGCAFLMQ